MAQEGLSDSGRSWSFAPDAQQGAEIATVPEEIDPAEVEPLALQQYQHSNVDNV